MVNEHTVDYHPSPSELTSNIHLVIFLWTPKGFKLSPEYFKIFSRTCILHHCCRKVSNSWCWDYWERHLWVKKLNLFIFTYVPKEKFILGSSHYHSRQEEITHFPHTTFFVFYLSRKGGDYGAEEMTKIKVAKVLVTSFDKFHHFSNHYIFCFCSVVPLFRFKHAEA